MNYAVIDVETTQICDGEIPRTLFWGYADDKNYRKFKTSEKLLKFLKQLKQPKILLHHSNFDVIQLLVDRTDLRIQKSHNSRLIKCVLQKHTLLNSYSVFPVKLAKIFKAFGYEKTSLENIEKRNYEDCVNGLACFLQLDEVFRNLVGISPLEKGTIAAAAFGACENYAGKMPKNIEKIQAFRGGRVEVFNLQKMVASNFDIHSSYPKSFNEVGKNETLLKIKVRSRDWHCPFFDDKIDDLLLFPRGNFYSWVYESNFEKYIEPYFRGQIKVIQRTKIDTSWLFEVNKLLQKIYALKAKTKNKAVEEASKLFLNSSYGRIGLRGESERARIMDFVPDGEEITSYYLGKKRWLVFDKLQREPRSNYPFAAFITDNARARLFEAIKQNEKTAYCDTDSIFAEIPRRNFVGKISDECGAFGYNGTGEFQAFNVKDYIFKNKIVRKGGEKNTVWTLKKFAQGKTAETVIRHRRTSLRKRIVESDLTTNPFDVLRW